MEESYMGSWLSNSNVPGNVKTNQTGFLATDSKFQREENGTRNFITKCSKQENIMKRLHVLKQGQLWLFCENWEISKKFYKDKAIFWKHEIETVS